MNTDTALAALVALSHPTRLEAFRLLVQHEPEGLSTGQLVDASGLTQSTFSTHLAVLAKAGLVKSEKRGRQFIQRAEIDALKGLMLFLAKDCCQGRPELCEPLLAELSLLLIGATCAEEIFMADKFYNVLFLCTGNSARSILAEALLNRDGKGRFRAFSAGSFPKGDVHPQALGLLGELGFETAELRSKSWDEFAKPDAPVFDFIFTVCDNAAGETCPVWPGKPMNAHWGIEDPAAVEGPGQREAFEHALHYLSNRISLFLALPHEAIDEMAMERKLKEIGRSEGATGEREVGA